MRDTSTLGYRSISDMLIEEEAYISPQAVSFNEERRQFLLTVMPVSETKTDEMCVPIFRYGPNPADYSIDITGIGHEWKQEPVPFRSFNGDRDLVVRLEKIVAGLSIDEDHRDEQ